VNTTERAAQARRRLAFHAAVPEEGPAEHIRNALALLVAHENAHPAIWQFSEELRAVEAWLFRALFLLGRGGGGCSTPNA